MYYQVIFIATDDVSFANACFVFCFLNHPGLRTPSKTDVKTEFISPPSPQLLIIYVQCLKIIISFLCILLSVFSHKRET